MPASFDPLSHASASTSASKLRLLAGRFLLVLVVSGTLGLVIFSRSCRSTEASAASASTVPHFATPVPAAQPGTTPHALDSNDNKMTIPLEVRPPTPMPEDDTPSRREAGARTRWLRAWAAEDFSTALAWARAQDPRLRDWALGTLALLLARTDPEAALGFCEEQGLVVRSAWTTAAVLQTYAALSPEAALEWTARLPEGELKRECAPRLFAELATRAPELAGKIVAHAADGGDSAGVIELVDQWTRLAPEQAAGWVVAQTNAPWQRESVTALLTRWAPYDTLAAQEWVERLPEGALKKHAREVFDLHRNRAPEARS